jgi:heme O synthase-like polyprenyltransferase
MLTAQVQAKVKQTMPRTAQRPSHDQRLGLAICSLIFGIPLVAIGTSLGPVGFIVVCLMVLGVNIAFALLP